MDAYVTSPSGALVAGRATLLNLGTSTNRGDGMAVVHNDLRA